MAEKVRLALAQILEQNGAYEEAVTNYGHYYNVI